MLWSGLFELEVQRNKVIPNHHMQITNVSLSFVHIFIYFFKVSLLICLMI